MSTELKSRILLSMLMLGVVGPALFWIWSGLVIQGLLLLLGSMLMLAWTYRP